MSCLASCNLMLKNSMKFRTRNRKAFVAIGVFAVTSSAVAVALMQDAKNGHNKQLSSEVMKSSEGGLSCFARAQGKIMIEYLSRSSLMCHPRTSQCEQDPDGEEGRSKSDIGWKSSDAVLEDFGLKDLQHLFEEIPTPTRATAENHAIFGTLMARPGLVEEYRIFRHVGAKIGKHTEASDEENPLVMAAVHLGPSLNGHDGIVHGGIISLFIDDVLGFAYEAIPVNPPKLAVTANLNINFRHPLSPETRFIIEAVLKEREGRKLIFAVRVTSPDKRILYCEATSIYVVPRQYA
mmetsp:Transcript_8414/g.11060  ORF Transcript_8414/g.11060 Transcript_8414/m.11060 type:complete len:293 (+) Transcript_8414:89-967(+)